MKDRSNKILGMLAQKKKLEVAELAKSLGVSAVTMRKDLDALEESGLVKREHGYAVLVSADNVAGRMAYNYEIKKSIARKAAELVSDMETVMIESGSSCALLAEEIAASKQGVTIITNSSFIAKYIKEKGTQVILLGGVYQPDSEVCVGPLIPQMAKNFLVNKFFLGVDGYDERAGFTSKDHLRAQAVRDMAEQAESAIVLTDSSKFTDHGVVPLNLGEKLKLVVTDDKISDEAKSRLEGKGIQVEVVKSVKLDAK